MFTRRSALLLACSWVLLMASTALAGSGHSHAHHTGVIDGAPRHMHVPQAVSPFEVKPGDKRLHCELLGHNPLLPCPHHKVPAGEKGDCYLTSECGGGPFQTPSSRSIGECPRFLVSVTTVEDDLQMIASPLAQVVFYDPFYSHSLDRPPRAL